MGSVVCARRCRVLSAVVLLGLAACGEEPPPLEPVARPVKIVVLGGSGEERLREFPGEISASANAQIAFEVSGKLVDFPVRESEQVERGDVLARLDPRDFEAALTAAAASTGAAKADFDRYQVLYRGDAAPAVEATGERVPAPGA